MASKESTFQGLGVLGPFVALTVIFVKFAVAFSRTLYRMTAHAASRIGEIQTERKANRVLEEIEATAKRSVAQAQGSSAAAQSNPAPAAASATATGPAPAAARAASGASTETSKPTKVVGDEPIEAPVSWPKAVDTAPIGTTRSGKQGAELEVADRHLVKTMGGKTIKLSLYRSAKKVERIDVKAKVRLQPYLSAMAEAEGVEFSMEAAQRYTEREIATARQQKRSGKAPEQTQASGTPKVNQQPASPTTEPPEGQMSSGGEEPPPYMDVPPDVQMGYEPAYTPDVMGATSHSQPGGISEPGFIQDSLIVDGETTYESAAHVGTIVKMEKVLRKPRGKKPFEVFEMVMKLDADGERKVFAGVDLAEKKLNLGLKVGDQISIQQGKHHFEVVTEDQREDRIKNVFSIRVLSRKDRRVAGYARGARG